VSTKSTSLKIIQKNQAIILRKLGCSYYEIQKEIGDISVASLSYWLRDIELTEEQKQRLKRNSSSHIELGKKISVENRRKKRELWRTEGRQLAKQKDPEFIAGITLYWAEGFKSHNRNTVALCNTDEEWNY